MTPVIGFAAPSGMGKTTLMEGVIAFLSGRGFQVGALKHGHHPADPDIPGKDTYRFRDAGARTVLFACPERWFMIQESQRQPEPPLQEHLARLEDHDIILVEGFKNTDHAKILLMRKGVGRAGWEEGLTHVVAVASDDAGLVTPHPLLPLSDPEAVGRFILDYFSLGSIATGTAGTTSDGEPTRPCHGESPAS